MDTTTTGALSVQLYSIRDQLARDRVEALSRLAEIGFRHVEPFGLGSPDLTFAERLAAARALRTCLRGAGLSVSAVHTALPASVAELAEECAVVGTDTAIIAHPKLVPGFDDQTFCNTRAVDAFADRLAEAAQEAAAHGLRIGYHNHWFEWARLPDGTAGWDRFWSRTGDEVVAEVDLYWATTAGVDPAGVVSDLGERVVAVHIKDGPAQPGHSQTPLGTGKAAPEAALRNTAAVRWHVAEIDTTDLDPYALLEKNAEHLVRASLSHWS